MTNFKVGDRVFVVRPALSTLGGNNTFPIDYVDECAYLTVTEIDGEIGRLSNGYRFRLDDGHCDPDRLDVFRVYASKEDYSIDVGQALLADVVERRTNWQATRGN